MGSRTFQTYLNFGHSAGNGILTTAASYQDRENGEGGLGAPCGPSGEVSGLWMGPLPFSSFSDSTFNRQEGLWSLSGCKHPPRQPMELVHGSQPPAWFPSQASCQEGCRGSRSEERILNHIYMCMMQKGKGRGGREPLRNPKRKSVSTPQ